MQTRSTIVNLFHELAKFLTLKLSAISMFSNICLKKTTSTYTNLLYNNIGVLEGTNKAASGFLANQESPVMINVTRYKQ